MDDPRIMSLARLRSLGVGTFLLAVLALGGGAWLGQADTAVAPEPARLTADLIGSTGATAAAVYSYSEAPATVLKWPGSYMSSANPPAVGTPCSTTDLPYGFTTLKVIQGGGAYRRCY